MYTKTRFTLITLIVLAALLAGCASPAEPAVEEVSVEVTREVQVLVEVEAETMVEIVAESPEENPAAEPLTTGGHNLAALPDRSNRLIIKNAELELLVADTDVTIDLITQVAADSAGYIISSRVWYEEWLKENYKYATITIGVPVDQFEPAMRRLRSLALRVVDESASGQDVTDEYVDLQSRVDNLKATRDRIREFLEQAETVEESLRINEELTAVEDQIEQVQGRMNYLFDRAAYSTITIQVKPELPPVTPTPTPTPTPAPTPTPPWSPGQTVERAGRTLGSILRALTEIAIWLIIVVAPLVGPPVLIVWGVYSWRKRQRKQ